MFDRAFKDWGVMFGIEASAEGAQVRVLEFSEQVLARIVGSGVLVHTIAEGESSGPIMFVFPNDFIGAAIESALMIPATDSPSASEEDDSHVETAQELMNLFCCSATAALEETHHRLRISQSVDDLHVSFKAEAPTQNLEKSSLVCVNVGVKSGERSGRAWCLVSAAVASAL